MKFVVDLWKRGSNRTVRYGRGTNFGTFEAAVDFANGKGEVTIRPEKGAE